MPRKPSKAKTAAPKRTSKGKPELVKDDWRAQFAANRAKLAASLNPKTLKNLEEFRRAQLATCLQILESCNGCNTPFEDFFTSIVRAVEYGNWPTPDEVAGEWLDEFRQNFDGMRSEAIEFLERYPAPIQIPIPKKRSKRAA